MTERLLQFIWQFQYFNKSNLESVFGEKLVIIQPGQYNAHQGPDFLEARIRIEDRIWCGNVELHINASDWHRHEHGDDKNYRNVILHVVWNDDDEQPLHGMPTLVLQDRISNLLLQHYETWMKSSLFVPCAQYMHTVAD